MMATALGLEWRCQYNRGVLQSKPLSSHYTCQILSLFPQTPIIINKSSQVNSVPMKNARFTALEIHFLCLQINFLEMMESMDRQAACWRTCSLQTSVKVGSLSCACFPKHSPNGLSTWKRAQEAQNWKACPCLGLVGLARLCELIESSMETEDKTAGKTDPQLRLVGWFTTFALQPLFLSPTATMWQFEIQRITGLHASLSFAAGGTHPRKAEGCFANDGLNPDLIKC